MGCRGNLLKAREKRISAGGGSIFQLQPAGSATGASGTPSIAERSRSCRPGWLKKFLIYFS